MSVLEFHVTRASTEDREPEVVAAESVDLVDGYVVFFARGGENDEPHTIRVIPRHEILGMSTDASPGAEVMIAATSPHDAGRRGEITSIQADIVVEFEDGSASAFPRSDIRLVSSEWRAFLPSEMTVEPGRGAHSVNATERDADVTAAYLANVRKLHVSPIIEQFNSWAVTDYGVECLAEPYTIERSSVHEPEWPDHMAAKVWPNMDDFMGALEAAKKLWLARSGSSEHPNHEDH